ncbi:quinone oxidoreductase [uncultured Ramlibacter sp.]|uniref:quinone oxidoreductase family protein n=1 Tax=uncultured Ramlibacter sp. TaxID=260755 RepID=UPI00261C52F3|nr:quinone oxidoreductase [uncultured Ramlibacter sp.]
MITSAVIARRHGGPEVLEYAEIEVAEPGPGELRIVQSAIGLNFADVYQRQGAAGPHSATQFPVILGAQGAGVVEAIGAGVQGFEIGQAVAYVHPGAYAGARLLPAARTLPLPEGLTLETAAASLLRGMTAEYLLHRLYTVKPGDTILVHAAAGGMGQILCAWGRALGATVIGTVGSEAKRKVALEHGCHHVIDYRQQDFAAEVNALTRNEGVAVVYDAVGRDAFLPSLDCLRVRGMAINFGTASGDVQAFDLQRLHAKSQTVCRPTLRSFVASTEDLRLSATTFAAAVRRGDVRAQVDRHYPLREAARAHTELESRQTTGAAILIP